MDPTVEKVAKYTFNNYGATFPSQWNLRYFKIVNLFAQRSPRPRDVNPNDNIDLARNPVIGAIRACQRDNNCKAIVAAWGSIRSTITINNRRNQIARVINTRVGNIRKGGYIGQLTTRRFPRHPLYQSRDAQFGPPDKVLGQWRTIPQV